VVRRLFRIAVWLVPILAIVAFFVWFARGPLVDVLCETSGSHLDEPTKTNLRACASACDRGSARYCVFLKDLRNARVHPRSSDPRADDAEKAQRGCEARDASSCRALGQAYEVTDSFGTLLAAATDPEPSPGRMGRAYARACDLGDGESCLRLSGYEHWDDHDDARAFDFARRACEAGHAQGCYGLGYAYKFGQGVGVDDARAEQTWEHACDLGSVDACWARGQDARDAHDAPTALRFRARACVLGGYPGVCSDVAEDYAGGSSLPPLPPLDVATVTAIDQACTTGREPEACEPLGVLLVMGRGVPADVPRGRAILAKACANDADSGACGVLAEFPETGAP
jgi:TPR repeat protein